MNMKPVNKILLALGVFALTFTSCEEVVEQQGPAPAVPENCLGIYFPVSDEYNNSAYEMEPTATREITLAMSRTKVGEAVAVPLTVEVNDSSVFVVPDSVHFAATDTVATFTVTFPEAQDGITYNLRLTVSGADYVNPYMTNLYVSTSVTLVKWNLVTEKAILVDGIICSQYNVPAAAFYVTYEKAEQSNMTKYRFLNPYTTLPTYKDPNAAAEDLEAVPDADGIYDGYPYNAPEKVDSTQDYHMIVTVQNGVASMDVFRLGVDWGYGIMVSGCIYGNLSTDLASYPLGTMEGDIITFGPKSLLFSEPNYNDGAVYIVPTTTSIYLTKDAYLEATRTIEDYNDLDYTEIAGAVSEFHSDMAGASWNQWFGKAVDIDANNPDSDYKNLYYLADLYTTGFGLAFYLDEASGRITIPAAQNTGMAVFGDTVYMSISSSFQSVKTVAANGVETYTLGLSYHYKDGTLLGEFEEVFYYSKDAVSFSIDDFCGNFIMTGNTLFQGGTDAEMEVKIDKCGTDSLVITGIDFAEKIYATFDAEYFIMSIAPQALADYELNGSVYDMNLLTVDKTGNPSETAILEFGIGVSGNLFVDDLSNAVGYVIYSDKVGGYADGYYNIVFTPVSTKKAVAKSAKPVRAHKQIVMEEETRGNKLSVQDRNIYKERKQHVLQPTSMRLF